MPTRRVRRKTVDRPGGLHSTRSDWDHAAWTTCARVVKQRERVQLEARHAGVHMAASRGLGSAGSKCVHVTLYGYDSVDAEKKISKFYADRILRSVPFVCLMLHM